jgi:lipoteichoic acid synthase
MKIPQIPISYIKERLNELIFFFTGIKILLFHLFSSTVISTGALSTSLGFLVILYAFSFLFRNKTRLVYSFMANLLVTSILVPNTLYLEYFSSPLTLSVFGQTTNLSGLGDSIIYLFNIEYLLYVIDLIIILFLLPKRTFTYTRQRMPLKAFLPFLILGILFISVKPLKLMYIDQSDSFVQAYDSKDFLVQYGIFGHHALDGYYHVKAANFELSKEDMQIIDSYWEKSAIAKDDKPAELEGFGKGKNLILIQVESLQNFVINQKVDGQEITPTLNKLLDNSIYFPNFYAQTIEGNSSDAEFLTQTSLFPLKTGSVFFQYPQNTYHSIGEALKEKGYSTSAVHADEKTFWNRHNMYPSLGFDDFITIEDFPQDEIVGMGVGDKTMFAEMGKRFVNSRAPFYSFIVTLSNHMPYDLTEEKRSLALPQELKGNLLGSYFQTVRYTDEALAVFIDKLKENDLLDHSIIVLYGDHNGIFHKDKSLIEEGWLNNEISFEEWYRDFATVPFIIYNPEIEGRTYQTIGGQIDVYPTLSRIMGIGSENKYALGKDLLIRRPGDVIIPSGGYVEDPLYIDKNKIQDGLSESQRDLIDLSNLIIKGDYFKQTDKQ